MGKNTYGHLLAEFLWWQHCSANNIDTFSDLLNHVKDWQDMHPQRIREEQSLTRAIPDECLEAFRSILQEGAPPPDAQPPDVQLPVLQIPETRNGESDSDVEVVCVRPVKRHRSAPRLKIEPLVNSCLQPVKSESSRLVKNEVPGEKFCPQGHTLALKAPGRSFSTTVVRGEIKRWVHDDQIACDLCKAVVTTAAWRCETCDWDVCSACVGNA